jgi:uncharacterized protein (DUF697 family)
MVINKIDTLGNPREWPPEDNAKKRAQIEQLLRFGADILHAMPRAIDATRPHAGSLLDRSDYVAMVPVRVLTDEPFWNLETLSSLIAEQLPKSAQLHYYQARRDAHLLRKVSQRIVEQFAIGAAGVASLPVPLEDIFIITPLQILMITVIGALAGRPLSKETALEFFSAAGITVAAGMTMRMAASTVMKLVPILGSMVGGAVAYAGTKAIGRAAEKYFFDHEEAKLPDPRAVDPLVDAVSDAILEVFPDAMEVAANADKTRK